MFDVYPHLMDQLLIYGQKHTADLYLCRGTDNGYEEISMHTLKPK